MITLQFLGTVLIVIVLLWAVTKLMAAWEVPGPLQTTIYVLLVVLVAIWIISAVLGSHVPLVRIR